jgi:hypothetical protein|nr:hypothetical protein [Kofleriaceae bacterium]
MTDDAADIADLADLADPLADLPKVAHSERNLIAMARALVAPAREDVAPMLWGSRDMPKLIGPTAEQLIHDALSHAWPALWRRGHCAPDASLSGDGETVRRGRAWERHRPTPLTFSNATLLLLRWLVATPFSASRTSYQHLRAQTLTVGDEVALYLALDASAGTPAQAALAAQPFAYGSALAWLGFAHLMPPPTGPVDFRTLTAGAGAIVVESLAPELAARWRAVELTKRKLIGADKLIALGASQDATLDAFQAACDRAHRRDLALFVVDAIAPLLARDLAPAPPPLDSQVSLSARSAARLAAGSLIRALLRWRDWDAQHRATRFVDDGYAAAQHLLGRYEVIGIPGGDRAAAWLADLSALAPSATVTNPREPA